MGVARRVARSVVSRVARRVTDRRGVGSGTAPYSPFTSPNIVYGVDDLSYLGSYNGIPYLRSNVVRDRVGPAWFGAQAMQFDGVNDYATRGARLTSGSPTVLSAGGWVKFTGTDARVFAGEYRSDNNQRMWVMQQGGASPGKLNVLVSADGGATNFKSYSTSTAININTNEWFHVAFVFNANDLKLFINGIEQSVTKNVDGTVDSLHSSTEPFALGAVSSTVTPASFMNGCIYDFRVYNAALSAADWLAIYNQHLTPTVLNHTNILAHYANGFHDISSNARHLTAVGGATTVVDSGVKWDYREHGGYRLNAGVVTPARYNGGAIPTVDALGDALTAAGRTSVNGGMDSPCITLDGTNDCVDLSSIVERPDSIQLIARITTVGAIAHVHYSYRSGSTELVQVVTQENTRQIRVQARSSVNALIFAAYDAPTDGFYNIKADIVYGVSGSVSLTVDGVLRQTATGNLSGTLASTKSQIGCTDAGLGNSAFSNARIGDVQITTAGVTTFIPLQDGSGADVAWYRSNGTGGVITNGIVGGQSSNWDNRTQFAQSYDILNGGRMDAGRFIVGLPNSNLCVDGVAKVFLPGKHGNTNARRVPNIFAQSSMQAAGVLSTESLTPSQSIATIVAAANTGFSRIGADGTDRDLVFDVPQVEPELSKINAYVT